MLSVFPSLLAYPLLGAAIIRIFTGLVILMLGVNKMRKLKGHYRAHRLDTGSGILEIIFGFFLTIGLFTQVFALLCALLFALMTFTKKESSFGSNQTLFYIFIVAVSFALLFVGPGTLAFDLPL